MPIPTEYVYILCNYQGYLSAIKQYGPIVHPAKVKKSEAVAMMLAGAPVVIYDPTTKMSYPLTIDAMNKTTTQATHKIPNPIKETVLKGAPKGAGDLGMSKPSIVKPKETIHIQDIIEEKKAVEESNPETVSNESKSEEHKSNTISINELIKNPNLTQNDVIWGNYTKSERRQIRAYLNSLKNAETPIENTSNEDNSEETKPEENTDAPLGNYTLNTEKPIDTDIGVTKTSEV